MTSRILALFLLLGVLTACGDPFRPQANLVTQEEEFTVYALTGTPVALPTAINMFFARPVRTDVTATYDVVFDIIDGQPFMLPPQAVSVIGNTGLLRMNAAYEAVTEAPRTGYDERTPLPLSAGDVVAVRNVASAICLGGLTPYIYGKIEVQSIDLIERSFAVRMLVNPNCGFRSFEEGLPSF
jgi:hypothetical protein